MTNYSGLWFGDIYGVIRNKLYEQAKPIKWFFFPYEISEDNKIYLIQGLNKMFPMDNIINSKYDEWDDLEINKQNIFQNKLLSVITTLENDNNITGSYNVDIDILKYTFVYFISNNLDRTSSSDNFDVLKKFQLNNLEQEQTNDDFENKDLLIIKNITKEQVLECLNIIHSKYCKELWNYLKEAIGKLSITSYYKYLIEQDDETNIKSIKSNYYYKPFNTNFNNDDTKDKINIKNIYNISKSLSHNNNEDWKLLEPSFLSLFPTEKYNLFMNIFKRDNWINLRGNLSKQILYRDNINYDEEIIKILSAFKIIFINLIFEELITDGLLNKFVLNKELTDKLLLPKDTRKMISKKKELLKKTFEKNKTDWDNSYYYLTNDKFKNLNKMRLDKEKIINASDKYNEMSYFNIISKDHGWPSFYAMDWISQISFFQHYIYHQVLYVTGATGQGKSTQVPKLLLYALKVIDYKPNGRVICTQPRITPTVENATRISDELGLPIEQTCNTSIGKIKTNNYWVQYKHQNDSHVNNSIPHSFLRIVTDGTLLEELKKNPTLFKKPTDKFINKNIWDIIIVDEAHEHNLNMDIIIALSKQACYFNNKVKLIIVSATMDDDEPIYRRYFKSINDKLMFPIKTHFRIHPIIPNINNYLPNSEYMDRRYHISPPGETTQYKVKEIYLDSDIYDDEQNMKKISIKSQTLGYEKVKKICEQTTSGEILFFANGKKEILDAVKYLNEILPPGNVALPFFSELNENYKKMISKINIKISQIKNKRENIYKEWGEEFIIDPSVPSGLYKRSIIIATNVAEASITIPRLEYVIDNGYAKVNIFNSNINVSKLEIKEISEASRLQRKGRVGRIGDGTVYYMYKKGTREKNRPNYKITQDNIALSMLNLLCNKNIDDINIDDKNNYTNLIISKAINPNFLNLNKELSKELSKSYINKSGLLDIYKENYNVPKYYELTEMQNYVNINLYAEPWMFVFESGQIIDNVLDRTGGFYLIHPFENNIKRNILNIIIQYDNKILENTLLIPLIAYKNIISLLFTNNLLVDTNGNSLYLSGFEIDNKNRNWFKSELAIQVEKITSKLKTSTIPAAITYISASAMGCLKEINEISLFLEVINNSLTNIPNKNVNWMIFKERFYNSNVTSDLIFIYNLIQKIKSNFSYLIAFKNINKNSYPSINNILKNNIKKFKKLKRTTNEPSDDFDGKLWNKLSLLKNKKELSNEIVENNVSKSLSELKNKDSLTNDFTAFVESFLSKSIIELIYLDIEKN